MGVRCKAPQYRSDPVSREGTEPALTERRRHMYNGQHIGDRIHEHIGCTTMLFSRVYLLPRDLVDSIITVVRLQYMQHVPLFENREPSFLPGVVTGFLPGVVAEGRQSQQ
eukprot:GHVQ01041045.1.p1 GENE.GHVQ01041045.1~~GHVQ01041045.1.p1  ORF type:complete len:110 (-),score=7.16 GHVQ01041045.1:378-707(-)